MLAGLLGETLLLPAKILLLLFLVVVNNDRGPLIRCFFPPPLFVKQHAVNISLSYQSPPLLFQETCEGHLLDAGSRQRKAALACARPALWGRCLLRLPARAAGQTAPPRGSRRWPEDVEEELIFGRLYLCEHRSHLSVMISGRQQRIMMNVQKIATV